MAIQILPDEVASQIAAGEVVERPASVVKELLENALDAQASQVIIRVEGAGKRLIEVSDDGEGIPSGELQLAVSRHATSKLRTAEDLFHVNTLGFRGEALASIASVSRLTLTSRSKNVPLGATLKVEAGQIKGVEQAGMPLGTLVRVEDLFYNLPARLKFLKQDLTERRQIDALVTRYAVAYPQARFQLYQEGRPVILTGGDGDRRAVLAALFGIETARQMLEISFEEEGLTLHGYTSPLGLTRSNRREITFFVNGRWVQDVALVGALLQAYRTMLMVGRYPLALLFLEIAPEEVDVNVHPAKAEVRFRHAERVFGGVQRAIRRGLQAYSPAPSISSPGWQSTPELWHPRKPDPAWEMARQPVEAGAQGDQTDFVTGSVSKGGAGVQAVIPSGQLPLLRLIGQVGSAYLVAEGPDGLYLVDQHAAHERVLYERLLRSDPVSLPGQALLEPAILQLSPENAALLSEKLPFLAKLGFEVELFGPHTFRIRAIPALLTGSDPLAALRALVEEFEEDETPLQNEQEKRLIARICKRAAVKAGQTLSVEEQRALLQDLEACQSPRSCPHGRPTMIHLSVDLLERQFGRRGSR